VDYDRSADTRSWRLAFWLNDILIEGAFALHVSSGSLSSVKHLKRNGRENANTWTMSRRRKKRNR